MLWQLELRYFGAGTRIWRGRLDDDIECDDYDCDYETTTATTTTIS